MSSTTHEPREATYDDLLALPDDVIGELIDGELLVSPRPAAPHTLAASALGVLLGAPYQFGQGGPGGWWLLFEPELHFKNRKKKLDALVPDLAGWRKERMARVPNTAAIELAPDWVCEILSPKTAQHDRKQKRRVYAREGVKHLWFVDPETRSLEVFRLEGGRWLLLDDFAGDDLVRAEPFTEVELDLLALWGETRPAAPAEEEKK
jgi:Uma2 family endonuclease